MKSRVFCVLALAVLLLFFGWGTKTVMAEPSATTVAATDLSSNGATLNGTVNAYNEATSVFFEYGLDTAYGQIVAADPALLNNAGETAVVALVSELEPSVIYHFRVKAVGLSGTAYGDDLTFSTAALPPSAQTLAASSVTATSAVLNGFVNPRENTCQAISFEWGTSTSYGSEVTATPFLQAGSPSVVAASLSGLTEGLVYHCRVKVVYDGGTVYGQDVTFSSDSGAPLVVTAPATDITAVSAGLNGTVNANFAETTVTFQYGLNTDYSSVISASPTIVSGGSPAAVGAILNELTPNTTYHYRAVGLNQHGTTYGDDSFFTTSAILPSATTEGATSVTSSSAVLNATVNANGAIADVSFEYGPTAAYGSSVAATPAAVDGYDNNSASAALSGLGNGINYHFRVVATNAAGTAYGSDLVFTPGAPVPTVAINPASGVNDNGATLNGSVNANGGIASVTFLFGLSTDYDRTISSIPALVGGSSTTPVTAVLNGLEAGRTYHYNLKAVGNGGTVFSGDQTFTTGSGPQVTTGSAESLTTNGVTLNGTINANGESTAASFEYGKTTLYGQMTLATPSPVTGSVSTPVSLELDELNHGTTYHYRLVGENESGTTYGADRTFVTSTDSFAPTATTMPVIALGVNSATLSGTVAPNSQITTVTFEYGTSTVYGTIVTADQSPVSGDSYCSKAITGLTQGLIYHYRIVAENAFGTYYGDDMIFLTGVPTLTAVTKPATGIKNSSATLNGEVNVATIFNTSTYFEYGSTADYGSTVAADPAYLNGYSPTNVSANLTGLLAETTYHFRVCTANGALGDDLTFTTPGIPDVTTNPASGVGSNAATLNGTVDANDITADVSFEYGLNTGYGKNVTASPAKVNGSSPTAVSFLLESLVPSTTYHYRVLAETGGGTVNGADMTFTTLSMAPAATTDDASALSSTGATLNGTVNANNESTTVTFEYGLTTAYGSTETADQSPLSGAANNSVSYSLSGLTDSTTYHYRVVAVNGSGTTNGLDKTFATGSAVPTAATAAASGVGATAATLNGNVNANGVNTIVTFEYGETTQYNRSVVAVQSPLAGSTSAAVSFDLPSLAPGTTYHYRVVAENPYGIAEGDDMTFTTGTDSDGDGVSDEIENLAPNNGDGNGDGTLDGQQPGVTSLPSANDSGYLTVEIMSGCSQLLDVEALLEAAETDPGFYYPFALLAFTIPCDSAVVRVYYHQSNGISDLYTYRKFGPLPPDFGISVWYEIEGVGFLQAVVGGQSIPCAQFSLADGQRGDDTGIDGIIVDQGGLAIAEENIPTLSEWGMLVMLSLLSLAMVWRRKGLNFRLGL